MISIGLPFHNHRATLLDAIRSVIAQSFEDWELILLDDGSSDGSLDLARQVADARVRVVRDDRNRGLAVRLNEIARLARSEYVARMDADDVMHPDRLRRQLSYLEEHPRVDLVASPVVVVDAANAPVSLRGDEPLDPDPVAYLHHGRLIHPSVTARRSWFLQYPYDESLRRSQDYELWCRAAPTSQFAKAAKPLLFYREVGVFSMANYLANGRADREVLRRYGPSRIGRTRTAVCVASSHLKGVTYRAAAASGFTDALVRRRGRPLTNAEHAAALDALRVVAATRVPGVDEPRPSADALGA